MEKFGAKFTPLMVGSRANWNMKNFNAASAKVAIQGRNVHPGYAKDKMINALQVAAEVNSLLPAWERPEHTVWIRGFLSFGRIERFRGERGNQLYHSGSYPGEV